MDNNLIVKAQLKFPKHKRIYVRVKEKPLNPFHSSIFDQVIQISKVHSKYILYIHDDYLTYESQTIENFEPVRLLLDDKLWIELISVFDVIKIKKSKVDWERRDKWN